jgi:hypothetical protein
LREFNNWHKKVLPGPSGLVAAISFGGFFTLGGKKRIVTTLQKIVHISRHLKGVSWDFASSIKKPTLKRVARASLRNRLSCKKGKQSVFFLA